MWRGSDGHADVSTTTCGQLFVPYSQLGSGTWSARVSYTSVAGEMSTSALSGLPMASALSREAWSVGSRSSR